MEMSQSEKAALFDQIISVRYEAVIHIDARTGIADTVHSSNHDLNATIGRPFPFESTMRSYIMKRSVGTEPERIINSLCISHILEELKKQPVYFTHFIIFDHDENDPEPVLHIKRVAFHHGDSPSIIIMTSEDITAVYGEISSQIDALEFALQNVSERTQEKNEFIRRLDDKVRNPLYALMGMAAIPPEAGREASAIDDYLYKISMSGTYMPETINDVLELRRIARDELRLHPQDILIQDLINDVRNEIHPDIEAKGLLFELDTADVPSLMIHSDPEILRRALVKLLKSTMANAVRGCRIRLRFRELNTRGGEVMLKAAVESRGIVLNHARLQSLLRPFTYKPEEAISDIGEVDLDLIVLRQYLRLLGTDTFIVESDHLKGVRLELTLTVPIAQT